MKLKIFIIVTIICVATAAFVQAQQKIVPRVAGLEGNEEYMELLSQERALVTEQDSIKGMINQKRTLITDDPEHKDAYTDDILLLESKLFETRNALGLIAQKTGLIEQGFILKGLNSSTVEKIEPTDASSTVLRKDLLYNIFFRDNIPAADLTKLRKSPEAETLARDLFLKLKEYYNVDKKVYDQYIATSENNLGDSLLTRHKSIRVSVDSLEKGLTSKWIPIYDGKIDYYNQLLDKIGAPTEVIEQLAIKSREVRSSESEAVEVYYSAPFAMFTTQLLLTLEYEEALAKQLGITPAIDSLSTRKSSVRRMVEQYNYPALHYPELKFVEFKPLALGGTGVHSDSNPIAELSLPSKGNVFKVEAFVLSKTPSNYTVFKRIHPLQLETTADGKLHYYAGTYRTADAARKDADKLAKSGIKAKVVRWKDGVKIDDSGKPIVVTPKAAVANTFYIELKQVTDAIRKIIEEKTSDKELSRMDSNGQVIYSLGMFSDKEEADEVAKALGADAKVIGITIQ